MSNFGYRVLGFGGFTGATSEGAWTPVLSGVNHTDKMQTVSYGFDTSSYTSGSAFGSISDATINGMVGSGGGGVVSVIRMNYLSWDGNPKTFGVKFSEAGASASTQQNNWVSITVNGVTFAKADARTFNSPRYIRTDGSNGTNAPKSQFQNQYEYSWYVSSSPFGTTSSANFDVSIVLT